MSDAALTTVIVLVTGLIVGISIAGFVIFNRFLIQDKERVERLGEAVRPPTDPRHLPPN